MSRAVTSRKRHQYNLATRRAQAWFAIGATSFHACAMVAPAHAGFCAEPTQSGFAEAATKVEAEKAAISWWASRAGALGRGYEHWDNAADKKVDCREHTNGRFKCQATAKPCLPEGVAPENDPRIQL